MNIISKTLVGGVAAGAMAFVSAAPAEAQSRYRDRDYDRGGISAGEIIAGALIIGGIAAVASAANNNRGDRYYRGGNNRGYYDTPRSAVEQCVYAAQDSASRHSWGGQARVTDIRNVSNHRDGYNVRGRIAVNTMQRGWRQGDPRYGRGWNNDYRGWNDNYRGWDSGNFTCQIRHGRVTRLNYSGIRGL